MLEWAAASPGPTLALLIDHDDDAREFRYTGSAESFTDAERITEVAAQRGWTVTSMRKDWARIFANVAPLSITPE